MKAIKLFSPVLFLSLMLYLGGCKKSGNPTEAPVSTEHPPATTVTLYLIKLDAAGNETTDTTWATVRDTSVVKGKPANEGTLQLKNGSTYKGTFILLDESVSPVDNLNQDIINEQNAHLFTFSVSNSLTNRITVTEIDKDKNGKPFGMNFKIITIGSGSGSGALHVQLHHHDSGNKDDNIYDSDLDRDFPVEITI